MHELKRFTSNRNELGVFYDKEMKLLKIIDQYNFDTFVFSNEFGFSPLELNLKDVSSHIGYTDIEIAKTINTYSIDNPYPNILGFKSKYLNSKVKGLIIGSSENSKAYRKYATPQYGKPYRDFYYILTFEILRYADQVLKSKKIGITHLTLGRNYTFDVAMSQVDAIRNYYLSHPKSRIESILFWGCCHEEYCFNKLNWLDDEVNPMHKEIPTVTKKIGELDMVDIYLEKS